MTIQARPKPREIVQDDEPLTSPVKTVEDCNQDGTTKRETRVLEEDLEAFYRMTEVEFRRWYFGGDFGY